MAEQFRASADTAESVMLHTLMLSLLKEGQFCERAITAASVTPGPDKLISRDLNAGHDLDSEMMASSVTRVQALKFREVREGQFLAIEMRALVVTLVMLRSRERRCGHFCPSFVNATLVTCLQSERLTDSKPWQQLNNLTICFEFAVALQGETSRCFMLAAVASLLHNC